MQAEEQPLITAGITACNAEATIARAVRSALGQTWSPLEVLVVDDGSTDATAEIVAAMAAAEPCLRLIRLETNRGVAAARNAILQHAAGTFVAFFDDDDESLPERIERQYRRIVDYEHAQQTDLVICHSARRQHWPDGSERIEPTMGCAPEVRAPAGREVVERILIGRPCEESPGSCATCAQMARLSVYRRGGGFCEELRRGEDTELNVRLARLGAHFAGIAEPLVVQHMNLTSDKALATERESQLHLLALHRDLLEPGGWYGFCRAWVALKYDYLSGRHIAALVQGARLFARHPLKTLQRLAWALPNRGFNRGLRRFYREPR